MIAAVCVLLWIVQAGATMVAILAACWLLVMLTEPKGRP